MNCPMPRLLDGERRAGKVPSIAQLRVVCQKSTDPFYIRMYRIPSIYFTRILLILGVGANSITVTGTFIGLLGCLFMSFGRLEFGLAGFLLLQAHFVLDCSDGEVARFTNRTSERGELLDYIGHSLIYPIIFLAMGWAAFSDGASALLLTLSGLTGFLFLASWLAERNSDMISQRDVVRERSRVRTLRSIVKEKPTPSHIAAILSENIVISNSTVIAIILNTYSAWVIFFAVLLTVSSIQRFACSMSQLR